MIGLAASLLQPQDVEDGATALPQLLMVNLRAGRGSSAALCRRCCLGQVQGPQWEEKESLIKL